MCSAPDVPKPESVPQRAMAMLPDAGDPAVRLGLKSRRNLTTSAMIFANREGGIGSPAVAGTAPSLATTGL